jgi:hypothetical protein
VAETRNEGHGRVEVRRLRITTRLAGSPDWPGARQVGVLERTRIIGATTSREVVFVITSLEPERADAAALLRRVRQHWEIENRLHGVRDVSMGEDASRLRRGSAPQVLDALRNLVLALIRSEGARNIAAAFRENAAHAENAARRIRLPRFG